MDKEKIMDKIERYKLLADEFLKNDIRVFIKDINDDYYFADILLVGEDKLTIQCFAPERKAGQKFYLRWSEIMFFDEYEEERK
jgi:hypothetical protein